MRARRLQFSILIVAAAALLGLGACGSSSGANDGKSGGGASTAVPTGATDANGQAVVGRSSNGSNGSGDDGGTTNIVSEKEMLAAVCPDADSKQSSPAGGSGEAKNYAGATQSLTASLAKKCENAKP